MRLLENMIRLVVVMYIFEFPVICTLLSCISSAIFISAPNSESVSRCFCTRHLFYVEILYKGLLFKQWHVSF